MMLSAVINLHREGSIASATITSVSNAQIQAQIEGVTVEVLLILDKADELTAEIARNASQQFGWSIYYSDAGDLGEARNTGVAQAKGDVLAFVDGDDLVSDNWFHRSAEHVAGSSEQVILHPDICVFFGSDEHILVHADMSRSEIVIEDMLMENCWIALSAAPRAVYEQFPYWRNEIRSGFGFEDWSWNIRTMKAGIQHHVVDGTAHFIRRKRQSLLRDSVASGSIVKPVDIF